MPGDTLVYTVTVGNTGTRASIPTTVRDDLPAGLTFVEASADGSYDAATHSVTWSIPALARDESLELEVTATVDARQLVGELVNAASIVTPPGYSPPIVVDPCADDPAASCARTTVPVTPAALGATGSAIAPGILVAALLALAAGVTAVVLRRRAGRA